MKNSALLLVLLASACESKPDATPSSSADALLHVHSSSEGVMLGTKVIGILAAPDTVTFTDRPFRQAIRNDTKSLVAALNAANLTIEGVATTAFGRGRNVPIRVNVRKGTYDDYSQSTFFEIDVKDSDAATMAAYTGEVGATRITPGSFYFQTTDAALNKQVLAHPASPSPIARALTLSVGGTPTVFKEERRCYQQMRRELADLIAADLAAATPEVRDALNAYHRAPSETVPDAVDAYLASLAKTLSSKLGLQNAPLLKDSLVNGLRFVALAPQHAMSLLVGRGVCKGLPFGDELEVTRLNTMTSYPGMAPACLDNVRVAATTRLASTGTVGVCRALIDALKSGARTGDCPSHAIDITSEEPYRGFLSALDCAVSK